LPRASGTVAANAFASVAADAYAAVLCRVFDDPRISAIRDELERTHPAGPGAADAAFDGFEAAVSLLVRPHRSLELLLIRRAAKDTDPWSGHVALPGGRRDAVDPDLLATARRETLEEVGVDPGQAGMLLGSLPIVAPASRRLPRLRVAPYVFAVDPPTLRLEEREVAAAVWVPVQALMDAEAAGEILIELEGGSRSFPSLSYGEYVVWGLTLRILDQFLEAVRRVGL